MSRITSRSNVSRSELLRRAITQQHLLMPIADAALSRQPGPQSYTLRAEALFQMGDRAAAIADLGSALRTGAERYCRKSPNARLGKRARERARPH